MIYTSFRWYRKAQFFWKNQNRYIRRFWPTRLSFLSIFETFPTDLDLNLKNKIDHRGLKYRFTLVSVCTEKLNFSREIINNGKFSKIMNFEISNLNFSRTIGLIFKPRTVLKSVNHNGSAEHHYAVLQAFWKSSPLIGRKFLNFFFTFFFIFQFEKHLSPRIFDISSQNHQTG